MAKTKIGGIFVNITANASVFRKQLRNAARSVKSFGARITKMVGKIGGLTAAFASLAAGGGLALLTKQAFGAIDSLAKVSDKLGIATEELAALRHAAGLSGVEVSAMEKSLQRFIFSVAEADRGSKMYADALGKLKLDSAELINLPVSKQLDLVADAMMRLENQNQRVAIATQLFGARGVGLLKILENGKQGLDENRKRVEKLGLALNRVDAAKIENANDAMLNVKAAVTGLVNQIAVNLAPLISHFGNKFAEAASKSKGFRDVVVSGMEAVAKAIGFVGDVLEALKFGFLNLKKISANAVAAMVGQFANLAAALDQVRMKFGLGVSDTTKFFVGLQSVLRATSRDIQAEIDELVGRESFSRRFLKGFDDLKRKAEEAAQEIAKAQKENNKFNELSLGDESEKDKKETRTVITRLSSDIFDRAFNVTGLQRFAASLQNTRTRRDEISELRKQTGELTKIRKNQERGTGGVPGLAV